MTPTLPRASLLEHWRIAGTPRQRRIATIVIERQRGTRIDAIAATLRVHRETVRRWLARYRRDGSATLREPDSTLTPRIFDERTCDEIRRIGACSPTEVGVAASRWSLQKLRGHLVRTGVVRSISIERLRHILNKMNGRPMSWREPVPASIDLTATECRSLRQLGEVSSLRVRAAVVLCAAEEQPVKAIAVDLGVAESTVRRWIQRYRRGGVPALLQARPYREPVRFTTAVRQRILAVAAGSPRAYGLRQDRWSLRLLQRCLVEQEVVSGISKEWLRRIVRAGERSAAAVGGSDAHGVLEQFAQHADSPRPDVLVTR